MRQRIQFGDKYVGPVSSEELYDHRIDANESTNLANKPEYLKTKKLLARMIPMDHYPGLKVQTGFDKFPELRNAMRKRFESGQIFPVVCYSGKIEFRKRSWDNQKQEL